MLKPRHRRNVPGREVIVQPSGDTLSLTTQKPNPSIRDASSWRLADIGQNRCPTAASKPGISLRTEWDDDKVEQCGPTGCHEPHNAPETRCSISSINARAQRRRCIHVADTGPNLCARWLYAVQDRQGSVP